MSCPVDRASWAAQRHVLLNLEQGPAERLGRFWCGRWPPTRGWPASRRAGCWPDDWPRRSGRCGGPAAVEPMRGDVSLDGPGSAVTDAPPGSDRGPRIVVARMPMAGIRTRRSRMAARLSGAERLRQAAGRAPRRRGRRAVPVPPARSRRSSAIRAGSRQEAKLARESGPSINTRLSPGAGLRPGRRACRPCSSCRPGRARCSRRRTRRGRRWQVRASRAGAGRRRSSTPGLWGEAAAGTNITRSSRACSRAVSAASRWPVCTGSKLPPIDADSHRCPVLSSPPAGRVAE